MKEKAYYLKNALFHPFEAFYEIRFRDKGSLPLAAIILVIYGIIQCITKQYTGFVINTNNLAEMNSVSVFISSIMLVIIFTVANWTITTLFGGKGDMEAIFTVITYSLVPYIFTKLLVVFLSNFIIEEEAMIIYMLEGMGIVWFVFLAFSGLCVIHEYGMFKNIASLLATAVSAFLIVFLAVLFLTLEEKMFGFISDIIREFIRRM